MSKISEFRDVQEQDLLRGLGLQRSQSRQDQLMPALGIFCAGLGVGFALALLLAPKSGTALRADLRHGVNDLRHRRKRSNSAMVEDESENPYLDE